MSYPSASNVPTTQVIDDNVKISWNKPYSGGLGIPITRYNILIKDSSGNLVEDPINCNGMSDQAIINNNECLIPMETLRDPVKFNLV